MTDNKMQVNLRNVVLDILLELNKPDAMSHIVIGQALAKYQYLDKQERSFITRIAQGTVERQIELDYIINTFSKTPVNKLKPLIRCLLRMSVYQLKYMDSVPESAVCNEAVNLAVKRGFGTLKGFVNGVLRSVARGIDAVEYPDKEKDWLQYLSVKYSVPEWIVNMWITDYPDINIEEVLNSFNKERVTYIRCNTSKLTPAEISKHLESEGVNVENTKLDYVFKISGYDYLGELESFVSGEFQVQDISSVMAGEGDVIKPADYVIDVCSAPGGKSINAALKAYEGCVDARDISDYKVSLIESNIDRLGINNIKTKVWDATVKDESVVEKADVVIADLPCSGLGIIGRKPDIRYHATQDKIESLVELQRKILSVVWEYVRPGGILVYSTCTVNRMENDSNVDWLCKEYPYELMEPPITILPDDTHTDGFFIARLRRKEC